MVTKKAWGGVASGLLFLGLGVAGYLTPDKGPSQLTALLGAWIVYHSLFLKGKLKPLQAEYAGVGGGA